MFFHAIEFSITCDSIEEETRTQTRGERLNIDLGYIMNWRHSTKK